MATVKFLCLYVIFFAISTALSAPKYDDQCGVAEYQSELETNLIRNGSKVPSRKYPWLAFFSGSYECSATIVSRKYILTAGHCVCKIPPPNSPPSPCEQTDTKKMFVVVGSVNMEKGQNLKVKRVMTHQNYSAPLPAGGDGVTYDIALIELEQELTYSKHVRPICLSSMNQKALANKIATTAGWGVIDGNGTLPTRVREGTERIVDDAVCQKTYYMNYQVGPMLCTEMYNHTVTDKGDSGGPLMIKTGERWTQVGITSYGDPPEKGNPPSVYGRVPHFCDWMAEKTSNEGDSGGPLMIKTGERWTQVGITSYGDPPEKEILLVYTEEFHISVIGWLRKLAMKLPVTHE